MNEFLTGFFQIFSWQTIGWIIGAVAVLVVIVLLLMVIGYFIEGP